MVHQFVLQNFLPLDIQMVGRLIEEIEVGLGEPQQGAKLMTHVRISTDPAVVMGKPCIKGTRITVELILRKLGAGRSFADLLEAYPQLTEDDLREALAFAADYMQHETVLAAE
jgi:uncharacterized protein (DUF433 family)